MVLAKLDPWLWSSLADHEVPSTTRLSHRPGLLGATPWSLVRSGSEWPCPSLVWITGHHPLLNAAIQVTSDEVHKPVGRDVYS